MKIQVVTTYIAQCKYGQKAIPIGAHARLVFRDGSYHSGDIEAVSSESITISRGDGEHTYSAREIRDIEL